MNSNHAGEGREGGVEPWARNDGRGVAFDSSAGFRLPNGAIRAPDASWVGRSRLARLTKDEKDKFLPLCPELVIELRSPSDAIGALQEKMDEYMANGARLGWLIDPQTRRVFVHRPDAPPAELENPATLAGGPLLAGFVLDLGEIWEPKL